MKEGSRIAAFDDSPFSRHDDESLVIGTVGRKGMVEGVLSFRVKVDGEDATERLIKSVKNSRFRSQVRMIALNGVTFAGLNIVDVQKVRSALGVPVVAITRKRPRWRLLAAALKKNGDGLRTIEKLPRVVKISRISGYYLQSIGSDLDDSGKLVGEAAALLRLAHIIASRVKNGESRGRI